MNLKANDCIAFRDSSNGLISANHANIQTLIIVNEYNNSHQFNGAMVVLNNLGEPNKPFTMTKGGKTNATYVNVDYLKELHANYC